MFIVWRASTLWFSRSEILTLAPTDTVFAIQLQVTDSTNSLLQDWLSGIPLISNRSLEFTDLLSMTKGEIAIFVTSSGNRSIAIRDNKDGVNTELLHTYSITSQKKGSFLLLSETLLPISGIDTNVHRPFFPSIGKTWLGRLILPQENLGGDLVYKNKKLSVEVESTHKKDSANQIIPNLNISMSALRWDNDFPLTPLKRLLESFVYDGVDKSLFLNRNASMSVFVKQTETGRRTLLVQEGTNPNSAEVIHELQLIGAFAKPTIRKSSLEDGTLFQEIEVDPNLVSVEEISTSIGLSYRVSMENGSDIIATIHNKDLLLSDSQELIEAYGHLDNSKIEQTCLTQENYVDPSFLLFETSSNYLDPRLSFLYQVFNQFSGVSFEFNKYSTSISLCFK